MQTELVKLKIKKGASNGKPAKKIIQKFILACTSLECSIFEPMIEENQYFEDLDKYRFLTSLKQQFDWAIARGTTNIYMKSGKCELCVLGHSTYEFYGKKETPEFAYIINSKQDEVIDIFLCNMSSGRNRAI